jgi:hypothetical protein
MDHPPEQTLPRSIPQPQERGIILFPGSHPIQEIIPVGSIPNQGRVNLAAKIEKRLKIIPDKSNRVVTEECR